MRVFVLFCFFLRKKFTTFSTDRIVALRSVNKILKSYIFKKLRFCSQRTNTLFPLRRDKPMTSILASSFFKLYPESNAHNEPIVVVSGKKKNKKTWDIFHATFNNCTFNFGQ
jgi:hypothetical protein